VFSKISVFKNSSVSIIYFFKNIKNKSIDVFN